MTDIGFLLSRFHAASDSDAIVWRDRVVPFGQLIGSIERATATLDAHDVRAGTVVSLEADFSPNSAAVLLALIERDCIVVPLTTAVEASKPTLRRTAEVETIVEIWPDDVAVVRTTGVAARHPLTAELRRRRHPGFVIFSSGSTGVSKAALHDFVPFLERFRERRWTVRAISFLMFDHIGGLNTLLSVLANGGCVVTLSERSPQPVCEAIERHRVELLPTSPTFLNLLLISEAYRHFDLTSLKVVSYGTEVMLEGTLRRLRAALPGVKFVQKYGLSELGILDSKTRGDDALWLEIGGAGSQVRVVDGMLEIRTPAAMLGYLNASSPFTADGWFPTGDAVEVDGRYMRVLGRRSEMINVGGEKVFPSEIEGVLQEMPGVLDVVVSGEIHRIFGYIIRARVRLDTTESVPDFRQRMRRYCRDKLPRYKIPQKVEIAAGDLHAARFKKMRAEGGSEPEPPRDERMELHHERESR